jgi:hypothetical protein
VIGRLTLCTLVVLLAPLLAARAIDRERSRFLTEPHGRPGTCAPFRLVFTAQSDVERVTVTHANTRLACDVSTLPGEKAEVVVPVFVSPDVVIGVAGDEFTPRLPLRRMEPSYDQPYAAVFASDIVYVPTLVPNDPGRMACDYFENREFFTDWRLLDGYDALIMFQPESQRPPDGTQRTIAEFCSLGGVAIIVGSFRMGEKAEGLPPPGAPEVMTVGDVAAQRMAYGPGAIYRFEFDALRRHGNPHVVLREAILDHLWFGNDRAPGGLPPTRASAAHPPMLAPAAPDPQRPGVLFAALGGAMLLICGVAPLVAGRFRAGRWVVGPAIVVSACAIAALATLQSQPQPVVDQWIVVNGGPDDSAVTSIRAICLPGEAVANMLDVDLQSTPRWLPRPFRGAQGHEGWQIDVPLVGGEHDAAVEYAEGRIGGVNFRDYAALAYDGEGGFSTQQARLLDWWVETNAYRGRAAALGPASARFDVPTLGDVNQRTCGALWVANRRGPR